MSVIMAKQREGRGGDREGESADADDRRPCGRAAEKGRQSPPRDAARRNPDPDAPRAPRGPAQALARRTTAQPALRVPLAESHPDRILAACDGVIDIVAVLFSVSGKDLRSPRRSTLAVSRVRQIAMYAAHVTLGFTMGHVGQGFGRDRTTVLHACHQIEDLREDAEFDHIVARVEQVVAAAFGLQIERG